ncbi:MAG: hypothetical protein UV64_C0025G0008 [Parcubacteria group bacterium GW2011_GWC1_43_11b]|uniref:Uncharacterized protein n=1 Tax=Candidatus Vogelbacteria bacterium RIFOXYB1_FULL_42_16 TaxID=1802436 RepID=A0A1G2QCG3_9BACT|nr:MAG: hypothetical protein UV50_C0017G0008 [Parcubacteria group bacterium GW2011_GWB1_42_9]KKS88300.1 MAG: hypothetical protein UV64_C0025G0008 [Parcubacteria group bacterium GW2011_GWC1_43_11b]KKT09207.1 MAG: hypothetical protein UV88_C0014G0005 [Parcubacteria group bacterium GW2011_GWA1_43_21]OHA58128.1 MAG: hypothetical protein A2370_02235 [Candidatus Vogelbacteria bacterium RIFOXYB1_FULL_42_16]
MLTKPKVKPERVLPTLEQLAELLGIVIAIVVKIFKQMNRPQVQYWIGHERELASALKTALGRGSKAIDPQLTDWLQFYREVFNLELDPTDIKLPAERFGFGWLVVVAKGLTRNAVFDRCCQRFGGKAWRYYKNLDEAVTHNDREPIETYVIRVRDSVEADECHQNKSANDVIKAGIKGITTLEQMLLELWYHWKTNNHLGQKSLTIHSGSRSADGSVPNARWGDGRFRVGNVVPGDAFDHWRVREVVSLPVEALAETG